ncbi:hypothetical protein Tco_0745064, partial [Tanacetum coccineum]
MSTILALSYPSSNNKLETSSNPMHQVAMPERQTLSNWSTDTGERFNFGLGAFLVTTNALFQADGVEVYDSDCDDVPNSQPSFMANISSYGSDVLAELSVVNHSETEITSDSDIIPYFQYVTESQQTAVQNSNSSTQQDALILSVIKQLKSQ